jgi:hypothetical protein
MSNALVAGPVSMTTPFTGTFLLEDGESLAHAIENGDWVEGGLAAFSGVLDTVAAVSDPLGSLIAAGLGWLIEHVEPLSGWFNDLTGDAGQVAGFAQTWANVASRMHDSGDLYTRRLSDLDAMSGATIDAYLAYASDVAKHLHAVGDWSQAVSTGLQVCSTLVKIVHDLVRDALSQIVGMAISVATEAVLTVGLATPLIIEQVAARVSSLATRIGTSVTRLLTSFKSFSALFEALQELLRKGKTLFDRLPPGKAGAAERSAPKAEPREADEATDGPLFPSGSAKTADEYEFSVTSGRVQLGDRDVMTTSEWEEIRELGFHNLGADESLLGKFEGPDVPTSYTNVAKEGGYRYFDLGERWGDIERKYGLDDDQMFDLFNKPFLADAVESRQVIHFSHNPYDYPQSALFSELEYLEDKGYRYDPVTQTAVPGRQR